MKKLGSTLILATTLATTLAACGGSSDSTSDASVQTKEASRNLKYTPGYIPSQYATVVQELYVAYFGRPADPGGLTNLENALLAAQAPTDIQDMVTAYASNTTVQALINSFGTSKESQTLYGSGTTAQFVTSVFNNVLGRAPQSSGLNYWVNAIDSGSLTQANAALSIMAGALSNTTTAGQIDAKLINNRLTIASYFTNQLTTDGATSSYSGAAAGSTARAMLGVVTSETGLFSGQTDASAAIGMMSGSSKLKISVISTGYNSDPIGFPNTAIAVDGSGNVYTGDGEMVYKITPAGVVTTIAGGNTNDQYITCSIGQSGCQAVALTSIKMANIAVDSAGNVYVNEGYGQIDKIATSGLVTSFVTGSILFSSLSDPRQMIFDGAGNMYVVDNAGIKKITPAGVVSTVIDNTAYDPQYKIAWGITLDSTGNFYVGDYASITNPQAPVDNGGMISKITPSGVVTNIAGGNCVTCNTNGTGTAALFGAALPGIYTGTYSSPPYGSSMVSDTSGNIYVPDTSNSAIRKITPAGVVTTVMSSADIGGTAFYPSNLAIDNAGNLYVSDASNNIIYKVTF